MKKRFIVRFDSNISKEEITKTIGKFSVKIRYVYDLIPVAAIESTDHQAINIKHEPCVFDVVADRVSQPAPSTDLKVKLENGTSAYLKPYLVASKSSVEFVSFWREFGPTQLRYAVLDTGVDKKHPSLQGKIVGEVDFTGEGPSDFNGHGTVVACLAALSSNRILNVKIANKRGVFWESDVMAGIEWAVDNDVDTINLSSGFYGSCPGQCPICSMAKAASEFVIISAAAGNTPGMTACPAKVGLKSSRDGVIAAGALLHGKEHPRSGVGEVYSDSEVILVPCKAYRKIIVTLPHGFLFQGSWIQQAELRELTGFDERYIANLANAPTSIRTTELLMRTATFSKVKEIDKKEVIRNLTCGDRMALLIHLRKFKDALITFRIACEICKNKADMLFHPKSLLKPVDKEYKSEYVVALNEFMLKVNLITGKVVESSQSCEKPDTEKLARSLIVSSNPSLPEKLDNRLLDAIIRKLRELDPQAYLHIPFPCPTCSQYNDFELDFEVVFFKELELLRPQLEKAVVSILSKLVCTEKDILDLPSREREKLYQYVEGNAVAEIKN